MAGLRSNAAVQGTSTMGKGMSIAAMVVAGLIAFLFAFDLALKFPFSRASVTIDVAFLICGAILGYLSWNALRDTR